MAFHPNSVVNSVPENAIKQIHHLDFGDIIFLDKTIVTELNEGIIYGWEKGSEVIALAEKYFGKDFYVNYMSNRINDYSVVAQDWIKFFEENRKLRSFCIVTHNNIGTTNIAIERLFYKEGKIMHFTDLKLALEYTGNLPV
ncbi:hypothetical protein G3I01_13395 [Gramella sp. MT6]|uniref:hypothetical protein n=1 Tax=Gramella sp. MT6 TaxID=2705471 RepID=UPI001C5E06C1|nr:hypothetical protein [Gramella sp. MT6]QYA26452.1 hypothetical protein G3I01_13395 [Gramella sp. MT6]